MKYASLLLAAALGGCVNERRLLVESDPPGAMVDAGINGKDYSTLGRTPTKGFVYNGKSDDVISLGVRKEGYYPELREIKYRDMLRAGVLEFTLRKIPVHQLNIVTVPPGGEVEVEERRKVYDATMEGWLPKELVWVHEELPLSLPDEEGTGKVHLRVFLPGYHTIEGIYPMNAGSITVPLEKME